jgi:ferredoxin-NADP reductase
LSEGDRLRVLELRNNFPLLPARRYYFVAGGIGVTPILPMLAAATEASADWQLLYGGRSRTSMAFLPELAGYGDRVQVRPEDEFGLLRLGEYLAEPSPDARVYCCGPEPLLRAIESVVSDRWPPDALQLERFKPKVYDDGPAAAAFEVQLASSGQVLPVPAGRSLLSVLEEAGVPILSSCQEGTCGTCETGVLEGVVDHRDSLLTEEEKAANDVMYVCVSRALSPRLTVDW